MDSTKALNEKALEAAMFAAANYRNSGCSHYSLASKVVSAYAAALSAQGEAAQPAAEGWRPIATCPIADNLVVMGWGEYRERDGFSPAFMRYYKSVGGWSVNAMPFYPTHWMPLPTSPNAASQDGGDN